MPVITKEIYGIEVTLDPRALTDMRFVKKLSNLMKLDKKLKAAQKKGDDDKVGEISLKLFDDLDDIARSIFGSAKAVESYQQKVADMNDGFLTYESWLDFVMEIVVTYQKNS